jgi:hypothetical protein
MTKPTIEELERAEREAGSAYRAARKALRAARLGTTGFAGHVVSVKERWGYAEPPRYRDTKFRVDEIRNGNLAGPIILANGTIGTRRKSADPAHVTDLGVWSPK